MIGDQYDSCSMDYTVIHSIPVVRIGWGPAVQGCFLHSLMGSPTFLTLLIGNSPFSGPFKNCFQTHDREVCEGKRGTWLQFCPESYPQYTNQT